MAPGPLRQDHGLIFASEVGTPIDPDNFLALLRRLCERAGLGHWHPHELRHSGASLMRAHGTPRRPSVLLGRVVPQPRHPVDQALVLQDAHRFRDCLMGVIWSRRSAARRM